MEQVPLTPDYKEFLRFLNSENVEHLVVGAFAVGHHGYVRSTGDMDIWVRQSPDNIDRLGRVMRRFGFAEKPVTKDTFSGNRKVFQSAYAPIASIF